MGKMGTDNKVFMEVLEWFDESGMELVHRLPEQGSGEIKWGAQLTVRESQAAIFFYNGKAYDALGAGRYTLKTANIPILTKILSIPWGMTSPLRAEVYFANMKVFPNLKWGTRDPVAFRDGELGLIRLRAFGVFNIRIVQPVLFVNSLVGTQGIYTTDAIAEYLNTITVSRFNDFMGENIDTIFNLPARYGELAEGLKRKLGQDFSHFGLELSALYISSITPPPEVQKAIDDKSRLGVFDDLNKLLKMKAAMAMETASLNQGEAGAGMGLGMGFMMPAMFAETLAQAGHSASAPTVTCPDCRLDIPRDSRFCSHCGHQIVVLQQCPQCSKNLPANAKFCSHCGQRVTDKPQPVICPHCKTENLPASRFCNQCGERI